MNIHSRLKNILISLIRTGIGGVFILGGLFFIWAGSIYVTLSCDRNLPPSGICHLRTTGINFQKEEQYPISVMLGATINEQRDSEGSTYQVDLQTTSGKVYFSMYLDAGSARKIADQFNSYIQDSNQKVLVLKSHSLIFGYIFGVIGVGIGVLIMVFALRKLLALHPAQVTRPA